MFYQELALRETQLGIGISSDCVLGSVFRQIHLAITTQMNKNKDKKGTIGVSFPEYADNDKVSTVGTKIRLFAPSKEELENLDVRKWLLEYLDYVCIGNIRKIPDKVIGYATYHRLHPTKNPASRARQFCQKYGGIFQDVSYEKLVENFKKTVPKHKPPFIRMESLSSKQSYCLNIAKEAKNSFEFYGYNSFGLDNRSSVPEF